MDDPEDSENRLYARRQYTTIRQMKSGLPNIPGVFALSKTEVKKDVREMERYVNDDTDSDSSILSEDVLVSSYPVKPRKAPKMMIPIKPVVTGPTDIEREYDGKTVDQTLTFLDAVRRTKKDLYNTECEREKLEDESLSYRLCIEDTSKRYRQVKQEEGNYFRVIQGFHTQALRLQMGLNRQNAMFYDVLTALQRRKEANKSIVDNIAHLKKSVASNGSDESALASGIEGPGSAILGPGETAVLRVNLKQTGGQVVLFKGQWIRTPMGDAKILSILPQAEKIVLQLPYGKLFANLRRAVCWGKANSAGQMLELSSDDVLRQKWTALQSSFSMPAEVSRGIRELVGQSDDEAVTDKDDDTSNDDSSPTDTTAEDISSSNGASQIPGERQDNVEVGVTSSSSDHVGGGDVATVCSFPLKGYMRSSTTPASSGVLSATISRAALRSVCSNSATESAVSHQMELARTLPIVFAPTASLPYLVEKSQATEIPEVRYCQQALIGGPQLGTLGSLVWEGDVQEMSRELMTLQDEINRLEGEQNQYIGQIQSVRCRCAQLSTDTSALRLAMFTRRVRHRNNLNSHIMSNLAASSATVPFPVFPFTGADPLNSVLGVDGAVVPVANLRSSRGASSLTIKEEGAGSVSRSSTRLVAAPVPSPSGLGSNAFSASNSCSPSPETMNGMGEKGGINGNNGNNSNGSNGNNGECSEVANGASRKRGRDPIPAVEILTSSRRRSAPTSSATENDEGRKSSSASLEDEEDEDEIKEETGSQDIEEEEKEEGLAPSGGVGSGRGGARNTGLGKKKPRKQRRI